MANLLIQPIEPNAPLQRKLSRPALWGLTRFIRQRPLGAAGGAIILAMLFAAAFANVLALYNPVANDYAATFKPPGDKFLLGTDTYGRDVLSRLLFGARTALLIGFSASLLGATIGAIIGATSAYLGGKFDLLMERVMDIVLSFPLIVLALAIVAVLGSGTGNLILAITIPFIPRAARVVRSSALVVRAMPYIEATRAVGAPSFRIILRHMLPNVMAPYLIILTAFQGQAILLEASLSFLGLGVAEPAPAWGLMLKGAAVQFAERAPWMAIFPGLAISLSVFAFNLLGDSLRDALDPRLRIS